MPLEPLVAMSGMIFMESAKPSLNPISRRASFLVLYHMPPIISSGIINNCDPGNIGSDNHVKLGEGMNNCLLFDAIPPDKCDLEHVK